MTEVKAQSAVWAKVKGMQELLEAGYAVIMLDGDVFLKSYVVSSDRFALS